MSIEAARARLDAKAPEVDLLLSPTKRPLLPSAYGFAQSCPENQTWTFEQDEDQRLLLRCRASVVNNGSKAVTARIRTLAPRGLVQPAESETGPPEPRVDELVARLAPTEVLTFDIEADYIVKEWAEGHEKRSQQQPPTPSTLAYIEVDDGDDNGVTDWWSALLSGCPIMPVPGNLAQWRLRPEQDPSRVFVTPDSRQRKRDYYLSRGSGVVLSPPPKLAAQLEELKRLRRKAHPELYGENGQLKGLTD
jgi:hypothetical protein